MASKNIEFRWEKDRMNLEENLENVIDRIIEINESQNKKNANINEGNMVENVNNSNNTLYYLNQEAEEAQIDDDEFFDCQ